MRFLLLGVFLLCLGSSAEAQIFYYTSFPDSLAFPAGWSPSDSRVALSNQVASSGYAPPPASGGTNVRMNDCLPTGQTVRLTVSGVISTVGKTNIRVGFGRRISNAWTTMVSLEWSSNGTFWNLISDDVAAGASTTWSNIFFDLPSSADGVSNLRFRFSYTTQNTQNCTAPPNFRIDDFAVGSNFSLPVELVHFAARPEASQVLLDWSTASETDNAFFAVEHSTDGRSFREIGRVAGLGTTRTVNHYTFVDAGPVVGTNYYRLRQEDRDGTTTYSLLRAVEIAAQVPWRIYPSPAREALYVEWREDTDSPLAWEIWNMAGQQVAHGTNPANPMHTLPLADLKAGVYLLRLKTDYKNAVCTFLKGP